MQLAVLRCGQVSDSTATDHGPRQYKGQYGPAVRGYNSPLIPVVLAASPLDRPLRKTLAFV